MEAKTCPHCKGPSATTAEVHEFIRKAVDTSYIHKIVGALAADMVDGMALLRGACLKCVREDRHMRPEIEVRS